MQEISAKDWQHYVQKRVKELLREHKTFFQPRKLA